MIHIPSAALHTGPPTHPALHIRNAKDAHVVLQAVRLDMLPLIKRRLTAGERKKLVSGNVFVWEEAENDGGLLRWTDGRRWSQSRMRGDYLFYKEKMELAREDKDTKAALRTRHTTNRRKDRPNRPNGLTKQTYSALVWLSGSSQPRKWHVVAYFTGDDYLRLPVVESYDYLRNLGVPEGIVASSKVNGTRSDCYPMTDLQDGYTAAGSVVRPDLARHSLYPMSCEVPMTSLSLPSNFLPSTPWQPRSLPTQSVVPAPNPRVMALSNLHAAHPIYLNYPFPTNYSPLSAEDRRVLSSFRVVLW